MLILFPMKRKREQFNFDERVVCDSLFTTFLIFVPGSTTCVRKDYLTANLTGN